MFYKQKIVWHFDSMSHVISEIDLGEKKKQQTNKPKHHNLLYAEYVRY